MSILRARDAENECVLCERDEPCGRAPLTLFREQVSGRGVYVVRAARCPKMREHEKRERVGERLFRYSGLSERQRGQTFAAFVTKGLGEDVATAKGRAILAAQDGSWLVLAGHRGSGKSHLAAALALEVLGRGEQARFRLVSEMLDELREGFREGADRSYQTQMDALKEYPCLVLDDLGKERSTPAGQEFLYQIVDARYRSGRQTVVTTNALTPEELASWGDPDYFPPMVSRLREMGGWVSIARARDFREELGRRKNA